ncbi:MAG: prepilin-type N-terminal cleavage/methylation domain-containing protein [Planctomycetes bacterium]|nr:prepilin-type N-terminal cleavage/methylation domain-containing protein [Planctomycetota bacterium]
MTTNRAPCATRRATRRAGLRGGFTLVELLAAMAILSLLAGLAITMIPKALAMGHETACKEQLRSTATTMKIWVDTRRDGKWPRERGIKFLLGMVKDGFIEGRALNSFVCPGTDDETIDPNDPAKTPGSGLTDWDNLNPDCISYAGRDNVAHALNKAKLDNEVIASDDNWFGQEGRPNHGDVVLVVYADSSIGQKKLSDYKDQIPEGQDWLPVGPESPDEDLKKLAFD